MRTLASVLLLTLLVPAQQPNGFTAGLVVDGANGPPWPVNGIELVPGSAVCVRLTGGPLMPVVLGAAGGTVNPGAPSPGGLLDLAPASLIVLPPATFAPPLATDATGVRVLALPVPAATLGATAALQAAVADPAATAGYTLTAAAQAQFTGAATVVPVAGLGPGTVLLDLAPFGFTVPFYGTAFGQLFINPSGNVTFNSPSGDFTPTTVEFVNAQPRIAPYWTYLQPQLGGAVQATVHAAGPSPFVQVDFTAVAFWQLLSVHTFWMRIHASGDIVMSEVGNLPPPPFEIGVGISSGQFLSPIAVSRNLSAMTGYVGAANEAIFEVFVPPTNPVLPPNPYDLGGVPLCFAPVNPAGTAYRLN